MFNLKYNVSVSQTAALNVFAVTTPQTHLTDMLSNRATQRLGCSYLHSWAAESALWSARLNMLTQLTPGSGWQLFISAGC